MNPICDYFGFLFLNYCVVQVQQPTLFVLNNNNNNNQNIVSKSKPIISHPFQVEYQWQYINFTWPSANLYKNAFNKKTYIPENNAMSGIKIYKDKLYISLPRVRTGTPVTLACIDLDSKFKLNELLQPFPSWDLNVKRDCTSLQSVQSMEVDTQGIMWVIDGVRINDNTRCPPKLVLLDLNNKGRILHSYTFPNEIALRHGGFLNDIVIDESDEGTFTYITDNSNIDPGLIVYSKLENKAWKIRDKTMFAEIEASNFFVDSLPMKSLVPIDGIALSPIPKAKNEERILYFCALTAYNLYSISTTILKDEELCKTDSWRRNVRLIGKKQSQSDGLMMDNSGDLYYTLLPLYGVGKWNTTTNFSRNSKIIDQNRETIVWPDSFAFDNDKGYLYLLANNIHKFFIQSNKLRVSNNVVFRILSMKTGTKSYLYK